MLLEKHRESKAIILEKLERLASIASRAGMESLARDIQHEGFPNSRASASTSKPRFRRAAAHGSLFPMAAQPKSPRVTTALR